ncbi:8840_t:CDS:1, partial [Ambispora gerdemannii]
MPIVANQISKSISTRLKELTETAEEIKLQAQEARSNCTSAIED